MHSPVDLLVFTVCGRRIALPAAAVQQIVRAVAVQPLPNTAPGPAIVDGVIDVHGTVVPVADVGRRLGLPRREVTPDQHFVLALAAGRSVALRVDQVLDLVRAPADAIDAVAQVASGAGHVAGVARTADGIVVIQDLAQLLSHEETRQLDTALQALLDQPLSAEAHVIPDSR
jgi:purine-binding chemotaxis protein CheW